MLETEKLHSSLALENRTFGSSMLGFPNILRLPEGKPQNRRMIILKLLQHILINRNPLVSSETTKGPKPFFGFLLWNWGSLFSWTRPKCPEQWLSVTCSTQAHLVNVWRKRQRQHFLPKERHTSFILDKSTNPSMWDTFSKRRQSKSFEVYIFLMKKHLCHLSWQFWFFSRINKKQWSSIVTDHCGIHDSRKWPRFHFRSKFTW